MPGTRSHTHPLPRRSSSAALLAVLVALCLYAPSPSHAQWNFDGKLLGDTTYQTTGVPPVPVPDGAGGAIFLWSLVQGNYYTVTVQHLNPSGYSNWPALNPAISSLGSNTSPVGIPDGSGGVIFAYSQAGADNGDIYVRRLNSAGQQQWTTIVCNATGTQYQPIITSDGAGGAIVGWVDYRVGSVAALYAQRVISGGTVQWNANGVPVCTATGARNYARVIPDGSGGAIFGWADTRTLATTQDDIYAQRLNNSGTPLWTAQGVPVCTFAGYQDAVTLAQDGAGGVFLLWSDYRDNATTSSDVYMQRVNSAGVPRWTAGGIALCQLAGFQDYPSILSDGGTGCFAIWADYRSGANGMYGQRTDSTGAAQWTASGSLLSNNVGYYPQLVPDGSGGFIMEWVVYKVVSGVLLDYITAQRVAGSGTPGWNFPNGMVVEGGAAVPSNGGVGLCSDGFGGAFTSWCDQRLPAKLTPYAQKLVAGGRLAGFAASIRGVSDIPADEGGALQVKIAGAFADSGAALPEVTGYTLWRRVTGAAAGPGISAQGAVAPDVAAVMARARRGPVRLGTAAAQALGFPPGSWQSEGFTGATLDSTYVLVGTSRRDSTLAGTADEVFAVTVHTTVPSLYTVTDPDSGHSVDNLPPAAPQGLHGTHVGGTVVQLSWEANTEPDLARYAVYRGTGADFIPGTGNRIGQPLVPGWLDSAFTTTAFYKLSAIDRHGNESSFTLLPSSQVGLPGQGEIPRVSYLSAPAPSPFVTGVTIKYGLSRAADVSLRVYDVRGRLVRTLLRGVRTPGAHSVVWDGRSEDGRQLPAGLYVVRWVSPDNIQERKVLRLR